MKMFRPIVTAVAVAAIAVPALAGCSSSTGSTTSSSEANLSGSPVSAKDDITALCASIVEQKLAADAAAAMAESSGYTSRVTVLEGAPQAATTDLREDRMNFEVTGGVVTACTVG
jgi:hypothetical protein